MQQEINLCLLLPEQKKSFLKVKFFASVYAIFLGLLIVQVFFEYWGKHREMVALESLNQELTQVDRKLALMHERYPMLDAKDLESSLKKLQAELREENRLFSLLAANRNFSNYLLGLAKTAVPELWLVNIQMSMLKQNLTLEGYAMQTKAIEAFMNHLKAQKEFAGQHFELREMRQAELEHEAVLHFIISTREDNENQI